MPFCMVLFMHFDSASRVHQIFNTTIEFTCELLPYDQASDPEGCVCENAILTNILLNHIQKSDHCNCPSNGALAMGPAKADMLS